MTSSNAVTAPSSHTHQGLGEGASINRITTILSSPAPNRRPRITTLDDAEPPRRHHPA